MHRGYDGAGVSYTELEVLPEFTGINTLSTAIVGGATRGPLVRTKITSAKQFRKIFGDPVEGDWGAYAALKVLKNSNCVWYKRVVSSKATKGKSLISGQVCKYTFLTKDFDEFLNGARIVVTVKPGSSSLETKVSDEMLLEDAVASGIPLATGQKVEKIISAVGTKDGVSYELAEGVDFTVDPTTGVFTWIAREADPKTGAQPIGKPDTCKVVYKIVSMSEVVLPDRYDVVLSKNGTTLEKLTNFTVEEGDVDNILTALAERSDYLSCELNPEFTAESSNAYASLFGTFTIQGGNAGIEGLKDEDYIGREGTNEGIQDFLDAETLDISTLIIPGVFSDAVIFAATRLAEKRGDIIYIPELPQGLTPQQADKFSRRKGDWTPTVKNMLHQIDSKFIGQYYPWVLEYVPDFGKNVYTPPSAWVASQFAYNDTVAKTWFAPAGFQNGTDARGVLQSALGLEHVCTAAERDILYADNNGCVNPIVAFPGRGIVIWGNKTSLRQSEFAQEDSSFTQLSVRRLCNYCRKVIVKISMETLFEPNTELYWTQWTDKVERLLEEIKQGDGIEAYKVMMDGSTVSEEDKYNGRAPGKVFIKPIHAIEWIPITFTVTHDSVIFNEESDEIDLNA